jgi:hypothetical protein
MNLPEPVYTACAWFVLVVLCPTIGTLAIMVCVPKSVKVFAGIVKGKE